MSEPYLIQFKLTTGEEIICEILEWNDEETDLIVVRHAVEIQYIVKDSYRMCTMRPWMLQQVQNDFFQTLSANHIVADAKPAMETEANWQETVDFFLNANQLDEPSEGPINLEPEDSIDEVLGKVLKFPKDKMH